MEIMIEQYDKYLSDLLDKHATKKHIYVVDLNEWMTDGYSYTESYSSKKLVNLAENLYYNKL